MRKPPTGFETATRNIGTSQGTTVLSNNKEDPPRFRSRPGDGLRRTLAASARHDEYATRRIGSPPAFVCFRTVPNVLSEAESRRLPTVGGDIASRNSLPVTRRACSRPFRARLLPEERTPQAPACRAQSPCKCVAAALRRIRRCSANPTDRLASDGTALRRRRRKQTKKYRTGMRSPASARKRSRRTEARPTSH